MNYKWIMLPAALLWLAGCATLPAAPGCTSLGHGQFCLLPPAALPPVEASHLVSITREGQQNTFLGLLHIDAHDLRLAGFSLFGTSLFNLDYDGQYLTARPAQTDWRPDMLVAMLELTLADPAALRTHLHNLTLQVSETGRAETRELFDGGRLVARIVNSGGPLSQARIRIEIPAAQLSVRMTPVASAASPP